MTLVKIPDDFPVVLFYDPEQKKLLYFLAIFSNMFFDDSIEISILDETGS